MQRAMGGRQRELAVFQPGQDSRSIIGRVAGKGLADELYDRGYLVVDGADGKAHYVALPPKTELAQYPVGAVVEVKGSTDLRKADQTVAALATDGLYRTDHHLAIAKGQPEIVAAHVRRLEALRRAGIVERVAEGLWKVPADLPEQGRRYDAQRLAYHLGRFIGLVRGLSIDPVVVRQNWLDAYDYTTDKGAIVLNEYARTHDPFARIGKESVTVQVSSVTRASDSSFNVRWTETRFVNGALDRTERWNAVVSIVQQTPRTEQRVRKNPLGIYVNGLAWSRELESSEGAKP
jgi:hypothetical protein